MCQSKSNGDKSVDIGYNDGLVFSPMNAVSSHYLIYLTFVQALLTQTCIVLLYIGLDTVAFLKIKHVWTLTESNPFKASIERNFSIRIRLYSNFQECTFTNDKGTI